MNVRKRIREDHINENLEEFEFFHDWICVLMELLTKWRNIRGMLKSNNNIYMSIFPDPVPSHNLALTLLTMSNPYVLYKYTIITSYLF